MKMILNTLEIECFAAEREWMVDDIPVLKASISLPRPTNTTGRIQRRIDRFYQLYCRSYLRYCETWLLPQAAEAYRLALESSGPLPQYTAQLTYRVTFNEQGIWSLYTETHERTGGRLEVLRRGDTWDLRTGYPMAMSAFFPAKTPIRRRLLSIAEEEIRRQESAGVAQYHQLWQQELRKNFNRERFYLTDQGLIFFYQMYAIAPAVEGLPAFCVPFADDGCRLPLQSNPDSNHAAAQQEDASAPAHTE